MRRFLCLFLLTGIHAVAEDRATDPFFSPRAELYETVAEEAPPTPNLIRLIGRDFKNLVTTKQTLVIFGVGGGITLGASYFDDDVASSSLTETGDRVVDDLFEPAETLGSGYAQFGIAVATYGFGKLFSHQGVTDLGRDLVRAQVVAGSVTLGLKLAVGRERPNGSNDNSFPSGHTSASFATATVLQRRYGWHVGLPAYAFAGYVAVSRINEASHYLSDVIMGATIGLASGYTVTLDLAKQRFAVGPMLGPDGTVGVQLTWLGSNGDQW